ncbi:MAG TPA: glycosyltransferase family 4 protein [Burkholderiales bacterium]|nr:glycosyltransferase family 4 protein [Burkholderiales bacterium]
MNIWLPTIRAGSGTDVFTERLAGELNARGHKALITWFPHFREVLPFAMAGRMPAGTQVIHANSWHAPFMGSTKVPIVATIHHCTYDQAAMLYKSVLQRLYHSSIARRYEGRTLASAAAVTAVSQAAASGALRAFPVLAKHISIIHNWVDARAFSPGSSGARRDRKPFRLLFVGRWSRLKGIDLLPEVMRRLGPGFELRILTSLDGRVDSRTAVRDAVMLPRVAPSDMAAVYRDSDALLFPSRAEGFGYVALEAQACGLPVVAFRVSSLPEVVEHGVTGWLADLDDVEAMATFLKRLASDPALYSGMREAARARVLRNFGADAAISAYCGAYERAIAESV